MTDSTDCVVVGTGVVGLACARAMAGKGYEVVLLEKNASFGEETSSRNSEVIHGGIYYPTESLKANLCLRGKSMLYDYCLERSIPFNRCGKLIVATSEDELQRLTSIRELALANGVYLHQLNSREVVAMEPEVSAVAGLYSETTGIIDSHALLISLLADIDGLGGVVAYNTKVQEIASSDQKIRVSAMDGELLCTWLINCAGLEAPNLASMITGDTAPRRFSHGRYFSYSGPSPFSRLVYPVPEKGGLGIHFTMDLAAQGKFGPDVHWKDKVDYTFPDDEKLRLRFLEAIEKYYPRVESDRLSPAYIGVRPKISDSDKKPDDFLIEGPAVHGVAGLINLLGIESPGLTASLAIGKYVSDLVTASSY